MNYFDKLFRKVVSRSFSSCVTCELPAKDIILYVLSRARTLKVSNVSGEAIILVQKCIFQSLSVICFRPFKALEGNLACLYKKFLHEVTFEYFLAGNCKGIHFEFFVRNVARGNAVQIAPNFPAKSLSI